MARPFTINVPEEDLHDLRYRLAKARLPDAGPTPLDGAEGDPAWGMGTPLAFVKQVVEHWLMDYDWRKHEAKLNSFSQFKCVLEEHEGIDLHFIHQKAAAGQNRKPLPILLLHGWPGSVWEFHQVIPILVREGYDVVAPSLPGYGFSSAPTTPGWTTKRIAAVMNSLMVDKLNYKRYFVQGGDWVVTKCLGSDFGQHCAAIHVNMVVARPPKGQSVKEFVASASQEDLAKLARAKWNSRWEFAYQEIQGTRPQTLGYGLNDSPVGLAAWILEKFSAWCDTRPDRDPLRALSMDDMLTNVSIYWFSRSIASSTRLYYEDRNSKSSALSGRYDASVSVPTAVCEFPGEIFVPPESWVRDTYNVVQWTKATKGGHFAALEQPEFLANDMIKYFNKLIETGSAKL